MVMLTSYTAGSNTSPDTSRSGWTPILSVYYPGGSGQDSGAAPPAMMYTTVYYVGSGGQGGSATNGGGNSGTRGSYSQFRYRGLTYSFYRSGLTPSSSSDGSSAPSLNSPIGPMLSSYWFPPGNTGIGTSTQPSKPPMMRLTWYNPTQMDSGGGGSGTGFSPTTDVWWGPTGSPGRSPFKPITTAYHKGGNGTIPGSNGPRPGPEGGSYSGGVGGGWNPFGPITTAWHGSTGGSGGPRPGPEGGSYNGTIGSGNSSGVLRGQ
ncbi:hypothetical protein BH10PLA2_BH10PLA2_31300 [soil metagenome]